MTSFPTTEQMLDLWKYIEKQFNSIKARPISGEHWKRVRTKFNQVVNLITSIKEIAGSFFEREMITQAELDSIHSLDSTPVRASTELLTVLMTKPKDAHDLFLETLIKTNQLHIYQLLICEIEDCDMEHSRSIRTNYKWLVENLDSAHGLITHLIGAEVLGFTAAAEIDAEQDPCRRNEKLLPIISKKDVGSYRKFLEALRKTNQEHVVKKLEQKPQSANVTPTQGETKIFKVTDFEARPRRPLPPPAPPHPPTKQTPPQTDKKTLKSPPPTPATLLRRPPPPAPPSHPDRRSDPTPRKAVPAATFPRRISVDSLGKIFSKLNDDLQASISMKVVTQKTKDSIVHSCVTKTFETMGLEKLIDNDNSEQDVDFVKFMRKSFMRGAQALDERSTKENQQPQDKSSAAANQQENDRIKQENVELNKKIKHLESLREKNAKLEAKIKQLLVFELRVKELEKENSKKSERTNAESNVHALEKEIIKLREQTKQYEDLQEELIRANEDLEEQIRQLKEKEKKSHGGFRYMEKPFLEETMGREEMSSVGHPVNGLSRLTILEDELFIVAQDKCRVEVYGARQLVFRRTWSFDDVENVEDIAACADNRCLYVAFWSGAEECEKVVWCDPAGNLLMKWSTGEKQGRLSVTRRCRLLLTVCDKNKLIEYSPDGRRLRSIQLPGLVRRPQHAVEVEDGVYVVSYGSSEAPHGVCLVSAAGESLGSFVDSGPSLPALNLPVYLAVDGGGNVLVADLNNNRVLLLDARLAFRRQLVTDDHGLQFPRRVCLDGSNDRLIVASGVAGSDGIGTGQVLVFRVGGSK